MVFTVLDIQRDDGLPMYVIAQCDDSIPCDETIADEEFADRVGRVADGAIPNRYTIGGRP